MQQRILIILVVLIVLTLVGGGAWYFLAMRTAGPSAPNVPVNPFGFTGTGTEAPRGTETVMARDGSTVPVTAFTEGASSVPISADPSDVQYDLTPYGEYVPGQPYPVHEFDVQYNRTTSEFIVTLNQEPLGHARVAAEAFLRNILGVTDSTLCALNVTISVPYTLNPTFAAYQNLGPSTCPGAVKLP